MDNFLAWSHSRRKLFIDCPKMLYHSAVAKKGSPDKIEFVQTAAMLAGNEIDNALTARIATATPLPEKFAQWEGMVSVVLAAPGTKFTQMKIAFDQTMKPCGYMDWDKAWLRVIYDLAIVNVPEKRACIIDWKNGMIWLDEDQLKLFAATGFLFWPEIDTIDTSYAWLKHGITSDATYHRRDLPEMWAELLPDVERMQVAFRNNHWPAEPKRGKQTCGWCSVNRAGICKSAAGPYKGQ